MMAGHGHSINVPELSGDFSIVQGSTLTGYFTTYSNGNTLNLTDYSARGKIKFKYSDTGSLIDLHVCVDSGSAGTLSQGKVDMVMTAVETATLPVGSFPYDIEVYNNDNSYVKKVSSGRVNVVPEVTN